MIIPDDLVKQLFELLDVNNDYLDGYKDQVVLLNDWLVYSAKEIEDHRKTLWDLKWKIEEQAKNE